MLRHFAVCLGILCLAFTLLKDGCSVFLLSFGVFYFFSLLSCSFLNRCIPDFLPILRFLLGISPGLPLCVLYLWGYFLRMVLGPLQSSPGDLIRSL